MQNSFLESEIDTDSAHSEEGHFEGAEKNLELEVGGSGSLRHIPQSEWNVILQAAKCQILSTSSNDFMDAYVLSESSLFVYAHKLLIKTCGTTTLLHCLPLLLQTLTQHGLSLQWMSYSRKNFVFPSQQSFPHISFQQEVQYLNQHLPTFPGHGFVLGPITSDHWYVFVWDNDEQKGAAEDCTFHLLMHDMDPKIAHVFTKSAELETGKDMTKASGLAALLPEQVDDWAFDPCGYSCNALENESYHTIHITPESHCSYASYETNAKVLDYTPLIQTVLRIFRPKRFTMTLFADQGGLDRLRCDTMTQAVVGYTQTSLAQTYFAEDYSCAVANYSQQ